MLPRIIDRYVLAQFVQIFVICYVSLTGLYMVIDAFANLDAFVNHADGNGGLLRVVGQYYGYRAIAFFDRTSGILSLIAALFTVTWIQRYQELTALMAAGISRLTVLRPVIVAAVIVALGAAAARELLLPKIRHELARDSRHLGGAQTTELVSRYDNSTDILLDGLQADVSKRVIVKPNFVLPIELSAHGKHLVANTATYLPATKTMPAGYLFDGVTSPENLTGRNSIDRDGKRVLYFPSDTQGMPMNQLFVVSDVPVDLLANGAGWRDYAASLELVAALRSPSIDLGNDIRVAVHSRLLQPVLDITLLLLGLPWVVARGNRNPFVAIGICIGVMLAFFGVTLAAKSLGVSGWLTPTQAAWLPLVVFVPIAVYLLDRLRR